MNKETVLLKKKLAREETARAEAERLLEQKSLELYQSNEKLKQLNTSLEDLVKQRTQALKDSDFEYQNLVESINDMIFRLDLKGNIVFTNQIVHRIFGIQENELKGKSILTLLSESDRKRAFIHFARQFIKRNCINYHEVVIETHSRQKIWLRLNIQFSSLKCKLCLQKQQNLSENNAELKANLDCDFSEIIIVAHDITQRKIGQEKLEKSEKRYRELTESLPEMICEVDKEGTLIYVNQFAIDKFGYTPDEVLNGQFSILELFSKNEKKQIIQNLKSISKQCFSTSAEYLAKKKNGDIFPVIFYTSPILEQEEVIGIRGVMFDITQRKNQELEIKYNLRQQEILSKISMNFNSLEIFERKTNEVLQTIGEHIQVSRVYIFEDSEDGLLTSNTFEWCNQGIVPQIEEQQGIPYTLIPSWRRMLEGDGIVYSENIKKLPKDIRNILEPQNVQSIVVLPLRARGNVFGFIGFNECNSNRKWRKSEMELLRIISNIISHSFLRQRIENKLVNRERENRIIINSIPDILIHADNNGEIKALKSAPNSNLSNLVKGNDCRSIFSAFNKKLAQLLHESITKCLREVEYLVEFNNLNWDEVEYYEARLVKLNDTEVLILIRDVTLIKEHEKQLEIAKNKAEEASKMKTEFLANVSHEIRTPLNAILGFSQWLFENTEISLHKGYLSSIINSGRGLLEVINNILDLSKLEAGKMDIDLSPMNYQEILSDIKLGFQQELDEKGLNFRITTENSVPEYIYMDELRLYQILFNVVSNAVKFTEKGYVHVFAFATPAAKQDEINLIISVEDTGIGIKDEEQERIFDSFTQQYGESNRNYNGTGLGLAIAGGLLKKLNGTIQVKSKEGRGTTFTITFNNVKVYKSERKEVVQAIDNRDLQLVLDPCSIMIVDDIDFNIEVLKALINSKNVSYIEAKDGTAALTKLGMTKPDLIFMDIRMPGLDGYEVTRIIKTDEELKDIPVIAFSASTLKDRRDFIAELFDDCLQKPVFRKDLDNILKKYLPEHVTFKTKENNNEKDPMEELSEECMQKLHLVIDEIEKKFFPMWENLKGSLVIYEIENFKNQLAEMASLNLCTPIIQYCVELGMGLQSFDIDLIGKKMDEFPLLIEKLKTFVKRRG